MWLEEMSFIGLYTVLIEHFVLQLFKYSYYTNLIIIKTSQMLTGMTSRENCIADLMISNITSM